MVLFSGQDALSSLLQQPAAWSAGALVLVVACKGLAYALSMSSFRGGPVFPAMFVGAAAGLALSHLPGLSPTAGAGMGIGAMSVTILGLPLTSVLLPAILLQATGLAILPLVIISVVTAYAVSARLRTAAGPRRPSSSPA